MFMRLRVVGLALLAATAAACAPRIGPLVKPGASSVLVTSGSMVYLARTAAGVIAIDLGWSGNADRVERALADLNAKPSDVAMVFLTHSHRDHIAAWPAVRQARFHMADAERPRMIGMAPHRGWMVRWAEWLKPSHLPDSAQLAVRTFSHDTAFVFGSDTLRAYTVPGHTAGSAVYLFRGVLFMGDAVTYYPFRGYRIAKAQFSDNPTAAAASLKTLWPRVRMSDVRVMCTAHGECAPFTPELLHRIGGEGRP